MQTKILGQMLYYILTTGAGQQTLGEEYCDITQVQILSLFLYMCFLFTIDIFVRIKGTGLKLTRECHD